jgi:rhodanese-related sulfurtransferase
LLEVEMEKVTVGQAKAKVDRGEAVFLDTRSAASWTESDEQIPGAIRVPPDDVAGHVHEIPPGRELITYCT